MSNKPLANPTAFTGQSPPWSLTQLDANFTAIQNTINDTLTYSNYFVDQSGVANSIIISIPNTLNVALTAGTRLEIKIANANTSAVTLTINALIAQSVVNPDLSALSQGQLLVGQIAIFIYDGIRFQFFGSFVSPAFVRTAAEIAAGIVPVNYGVPNHLAIGEFIVDRYGINTTPGTTIMSTAIGNAISVATQVGGGRVRLLTANYATNAAVVVPDFVTFCGQGRLLTTLTPTGTFNAVSVHGTNESPNFANARSVQGMTINGASLTGNGLDILFAGLRCYFSDLYIINCIGIGMKISGSFDHLYERIECRGNLSFGIQTYEQQVAYDAVFNEMSFLRFLEVVSVSNNNGVQLAYTSVTGTYTVGEVVNQAVSLATGTVSYYDKANLRLFVRAVTGTFNNANVVTGATSGATGTPLSNSGGTSQNLTQWDCAGGDNYYFISIKPTEGLVGIDFSRSSNMHRIGQLYYDQIVSLIGTGTAVQVSKPSSGFTQFLTIDTVNSFQGGTGVSVIQGQNIFIGAVQMNSSGTQVIASSGVTGPVFLRTPRTAFTDPNVPQIIYPDESITTYTPSFGGTGGSPALGNGTITGETYQHGNKVSLRIVFTFQNTTVMATTALSLGLPAALGVKGAEGQSALALAFRTSTGVYTNAIAVLSGTTLTIPTNGAASSWNATTPFTWAAGDQLTITAEYEVN